KQGLRKADLLEAFQGSLGSRYDQIKKASIQNTLLYEEHTWGAAHSITNPDDPEVYSQRLHKSKTAYEAADLSAYVLGKQMEKFANNPLQSSAPEGILLVNTANVEQEVEVRLAKWSFLEGRNLSAIRMKQYLPYTSMKENMESYGKVKLEPFSWMKIPYQDLLQMKAN